MSILILNISLIKQEIYIRKEHICESLCKKLGEKSERNNVAFSTLLVLRTEGEKIRIPMEKVVTESYKSNKHCTLHFLNCNGIEQNLNYWCDAKHP